MLLFSWKVVNLTFSFIYPWYCVVIFFEGLYYLINNFFRKNRYLKTALNSNIGRIDMKEVKLNLLTDRELENWNIENKLKNSAGTLKRQFKLQILRQIHQKSETKTSNKINCIYKENTWSLSIINVKQYRHEEYLKIF